MALASRHEATVDELINLMDRMDAIYRNANSETPEYEDLRRRVREIGEALNQVGGKEMMLRVHARVTHKRRDLNRYLDWLWNMIGKWRG